MKKHRITVNDILDQDDLKELAKQLVESNPSWAILITPAGEDLIVVGRHNVDVIQCLGILILAQQTLIDAHTEEVDGEVNSE